ncbi:hypothetical protein AMJ86_00765 [bacterium SM23_57]|nr:MAG: hypothetical protein AMJ86_00765 [bacterium SM23_57]
MKERLQNWITTALGILIALFGGFLLWKEKLALAEVMPLWVLSWALITAKDSLLEGITLGLWKPKQ